MIFAFKDGFYKFSDTTDLFKYNNYCLSIRRSLIERSVYTENRFIVCDNDYWFSCCFIFVAVNVTKSYNLLSENMSADESALPQESTINCCSNGTNSCGNISNSCN